MTETQAKGSRYNVRVLDRAACILAALSDGKLHTLTELSEKVALNSSTAFRILWTLASHRYVERDEWGGYRLGLACLELARAYNEGHFLRQTAFPELEMLRDQTRETAHLAVLDRFEVVYLEKLHGLHAVGIMSSSVGRRSPAHCTGLGKMLLAQVDPALISAHYGRAGLQAYTSTTIRTLDDLTEELGWVREHGYALDRGEHEAEVRCVAAPIFDVNGRIAAAISVAGPGSRLDPIEDNEDLIRAVCRAARTISSRLGYRSA